MKKFFESRKNRLMIAGILAAIAAGVTGEQSWNHVVYEALTLLGANIIGISIEDHGLKLSGRSK